MNIYGAGWIGQQLGRMKRLGDGIIEIRGVSFKDNGVRDRKFLFTCIVEREYRDEVPILNKMILGQTMHHTCLVYLY